MANDLCGDPVYLGDFADIPWPDTVFAVYQAAPSVVQRRGAHSMGH